MSIDEAVLPSAVQATVTKAAKDARRAMAFTVFAVCVAIVVLAIDNSIKRSIVAEAEQVREIFAQFKEATGALKTSIENSAADSAADSAGDPDTSGPAKPARAPKAPAGDANGKPPAAAGRAGSSRARP